MIAFVIIVALVVLFVLFDEAPSATPPRENEPGRQRAPPGNNRSINRGPVERPPSGPPANPAIGGGRGAQWAITAVMLLGAGGCTHVPVWKQGVVSQPNMIFHERGAFVYGPRQNAQLEPGAAGSSGATAAGCTACK